MAGAHPEAGGGWYARVRRALARKAAAEQRRLQRMAVVDAPTFLRDRLLAVVKMEVLAFDAVVEEVARLVPGERESPDTYAARIQRAVSRRHCTCSAGAKCVVWKDGIATGMKVVRRTLLAA